MRFKFMRDGRQDSLNFQEIWNIKYTFKNETGKQFLIEPLYLQDIAAVRRNIRQEVAANNVWDLVFLTGADKSYFRESRMAIHSLLKSFPKHKIIYYDPELEMKEQFEVSDTFFLTFLFQSFCVFVCLFVSLFVHLFVFCLFASLFLSLFCYNFCKT